MLGEGTGEAKRLDLGVSIIRCPRCGKACGNEVDVARGVTVRCQFCGYTNPTEAEMAKAKITVDRTVGLGDDQIEVELTLRGDVAQVIRALTSGLPRAVLEEFRDALAAELAKGRTA